MQISWVLFAENVVVNEQLQRIDILGEFRSVIADQVPYSILKFYIICRAEADARNHAAMPYRVTLRRPSDELVELHNSDVSVTIPPHAGRVVGTLIAEIRDFEIKGLGRHTITAKLGESVYGTDFMVVSQRTIANDTQE
ncbi:MAG: hypothetical protein OXN88_10830 [Chloroflexota bacterium]|nr:hypothetical protein [Chloroflexota bacterium]